MSDNAFLVIPEDPEFRPEKAAIARAEAVLRVLAPRAGDVVVVHDGEAIRFFDCGENFMRTLCPGCGAEIPTEEWHEMMESDFDEATKGFTMNRHQMRCCDARVTVNDLTYDWPQGFARFGIEAMNPDRAPLTGDEIARLAEALGAPVRVILTHL